jgi:hypothetical protein
MSGQTARNFIYVCGAMVATCKGNALKRQIQDKCCSCTLGASYWGCRITKEKSTMNSWKVLWEDIHLRVHLTRAALHSCTSNHNHHRHLRKVWGLLWCNIWHNKILRELSVSADSRRCSPTDHHTDQQICMSERVCAHICVCVWARKCALVCVRASECVCVCNSEE